MKFIISRATYSKEAKPPCKGAVLEYDASWLTFNNTVWSIEANTIEDILKLADIEPNGIIISKIFGNDAKKSIADYEIMIYDGFIE